VGLCIGAKRRKAERPPDPGLDPGEEAKPGVGPAPGV